ncbi:MAG: hypothetical protein KDI88_04180, partial [Gammaproteobacteria bacterium]|nr:hypothetical protein [Gammaproteobacteria bacterium]
MKRGIAPVACATAKTIAWPCLLVLALAGSPVAWSADDAGDATATAASAESMALQQQLESLAAERDDIAARLGQQGEALKAAEAASVDRQAQLEALTRQLQTANAERDDVTARLGQQGEALKAAEAAAAEQREQVA